MSYKYSKGNQIIGDLSGSDDSDRNTGIDFEEDYIGFETSGSTVMVVSGSKVGIGTTTPDYELDVAGNIGLDEYIYHNGDADTYIQFPGATNQINLVANTYSFLKYDGIIKLNAAGRDRDTQVFAQDDSVVLHVDAGNAMVGIGTDTPDYTLDVAGNIGVDQYIYHNGDANTYINFTDDRIRMKAGGMGFIGMHKKDSAPHQVTINNGNNNIDFVVNSNNNSNDPILRCDASAASVGIRTASPVASLTVNGSIAMKITSIDNGDSPYSITATDHIILADSFGGAITINLPACSSNSGRIIIVKDVGAGAGSNNITISRDGSDQIDGSTSIAINTNRGYVQLVCDGSQFWHQIAKEGVS